MAIKRRKKSGVRWVGPAKLVAESQASSSDSYSGPSGGYHDAAYQQAHPARKPIKTYPKKAPPKKDPPKAAPPKKQPPKRQPPKKTTSQTSASKKA